MQEGRGHEEQRQEYSEQTVGPEQGEWSLDPCVAPASGLAMSGSQDQSWRSRSVDLKECNAMVLPPTPICLFHIWVGPGKPRPPSHLAQG